MTKPLEAKGVLRYWRNNARKYGPSYRASWTDLPAIEMETRELARRLSDGDRVLDVGCGNGFTTVNLASQKRLRVRGVDVVPAMIRNARGRLRRNRTLSAKIKFGIGDIRSLSEPAGHYDKVIAVRVFINLTTAGDRRKALRECARVLRPGGRLLLSEAILENWRRLNRLRREWELPIIPMPAFNRYLVEKNIIRLASTHFRLLESVDFSSTYYVGTRVLKPLLMRLLGKTKDPADPLTEWNRWFSRLPAWGDYGTQKLFVFEKK